MKLKIGVIGTSIWQQNMPLLEKLTIDREFRPAVLKKLKEKLGLEELIYLATCNRVEFIYAAGSEIDDNQLLHRLIDFFFSSGRDIDFSPNDLFHYQDKDAVIHLFRTCCSLDSLVIGENQITGQFKDAGLQAVADGLSGKTLDHLMQEALAAARKVKSQTSIGNGAVSMASLAFNEIKNEVDGGERLKIALVGTGKMPEKMARYCRDSFSCELIFVNRTFQKAEALAEKFNGRSMDLDDFIENPPEADVIIAATASPNPIFNCAFRSRLLAQTPQVICVDLAVPRDFCAEFGDDNRITLIDIPTLKKKSDGSLRRKFVEAGKANEIVRIAVEKFLSQRIEISLKPIFQDSYEDSLKLARQKLDTLFSDRLASLDSDSRKEIENVVAKIIGYTCFNPVKKLSRELVGGSEERQSEAPVIKHRKTA